ncbi:MAG: hypothetical protein HQ559_05480 [Lentisphaerae bacterium]|nr:hypothetical protein [Lentisphaerota bacterium]
MSLIQEALRRQKDAAGGGESPEQKTPPRLKPSEEDTPAETAHDTPVKEPQATLAEAAPKQPAPPPPVAPPPPPAPKPTPKTEVAREEEVESEPEPGKESSPRAWPVLLAAILVVVLLVGGAVWIAMYALQRGRNTEDSPRSSDSQPAASTGTTIDEQPTPAGVQPADPLQSTLPPVEPPSSTDTPSQPLATPDEPASPPEESSAPARPPVNWPKLALEGVVGKGQMGAAKVNGRIVGVGESIEGAVLISLDKKGVMLEFEGERQFLKLGTTID